MSRDDLRELIDKAQNLWYKKTYCIITIKQYEQELNKIINDCLVR
jgi:hypothetical protein